MPEEQRPLKAFLCHASGDKPAVRELYKYLVKEGVDAWLDEEKLLPGQDWNEEILRALQESDAIIICLSRMSVSKEGYVQREIKEAIEKAKEKPSRTIFVIPSKIDHCELPNYLKQWQAVDLFAKNGYERLMRSLQARANKVGAVIKPASIEEFVDEELENELKRLFFEGRGAFLVENWEKAIHRFRKILSLRPNYLGASEQLAEAEHQRSLAKRYLEGVEAVREENWQVAIDVLAELLEDAANYKDAASFLEVAKKQKELHDLYTEAQQLHVAGQWQAVVKVFELIVDIDSNYQDRDGLLLSARKEAAEMERLAELNELYSQSVKSIDKGQWYEARRVLERIHKSQTGFLETELLLRKVENEISRIEEFEKRKVQINTLYEQARGLFHSHLWQQALNKLNEIWALDPNFDDVDSIALKVNAELEQEKKRTELQNKLATMYSQAVMLLKDGKHQEALNKWQEIKTLDPKYHDRQNIQAKFDEYGKRTIVQLLKKYWISLSIAAILLAVSLVTSVIFAANKIKEQVSNTAEPSSTAEPLLSRIEDEKGVPMVLVSAGTFMMGRDDGATDEAPLHEVYLDAYYIDQYEVTNARYRECEQAGVCEPPQEVSSKAGPASYYRGSYYDKYPVIYVDWIMAKKYCEWRSASLPTEAQWEKAARGTDKRLYPWGDTEVACHLVNYVGCPQAGTQEVTRYPSGQSPYKVYNMAGNVWEWVGDWYLAAYYKSSPTNNPTGPSHGLSHVLKGGSFYDTADNLYVTKRWYRAPTIADYNIGFRCARSTSEVLPK
jgi:formylglycine-generating enzyme required for sulfatase activity